MVGIGGENNSMGRSHLHVLTNDWELPKRKIEASTATQSRSDIFPKVGLWHTFCDLQKKAEENNIAPYFGFASSSVLIFTQRCLNRSPTSIVWSSWKTETERSGIHGVRKSPPGSAERRYLLGGQLPLRKGGG